MSPAGRFRQSLVYRIGGVFLLLLFLTTATAVLMIRHFVRDDLEAGTRKEMLHSMTRLEAELRRLQEQVLLFAKLSARAAQVRDPVASSTLQITAIEESRDLGIEIDRVSEESPREGSREVLRRGFAGMPTVDFEFRGKGPGRFHIVAVAPLSFAGTDRQVIVASMSLGREFLRRQRELLGGEIALITREEVVVSSSSCIACMHCLEQVLGGEGPWKILGSGKPIYSIFDCDPEPQAAVVLPLRAFGGEAVALAVFRSRKNEMMALRHATLGALGGGVLFSLVAGGLFLFFTYRAIRPLRELTRIAGGISEGRYGETIPVRGNDEVAELATAFNRMSRSLRDASREITEWNRTLETRVEEKTRELEKIHRHMVDVEKLAAVGQLAAGVVHELNNPLSGIMGYADVALELYKDRPDEQIGPDDRKKMIAYFGHISTLTQRCRSIIVDMLTFARQHREEPREARLNDLVEETLLFLDKQLSKRKVEVVREFQKGLPTFLANPVQLQQVFTNLVLNAAQAMPEGGTLTVRTRQTGDRLEAEFADTGTGISPELRKRIFEPFFTTKPVGEGTGLGLSVSYGIVQKHGGDIRVESEPGKGSVFTVVLPIRGLAA
ncbi:MAG: hypothetical protein Kow00128_00110 [Deltaproteobacteria bacterium]